MVLDGGILKNHLDLETAGSILALVNTRKYPESTHREALYVSVNLQSDRFWNFIETRRLEQFDIEDGIVKLGKCPSILKIFKIFCRAINELCFGKKMSAPSPIYGALNCCSSTGGAPWFGDYWLKLETNKIKHRTTFTQKDSLDLTGISANGNFSAQTGCKAIITSIMDWEGAVAYFQSKGHTCPTVNSPNIRDYVEAQIWGGVGWDDVEEINVVISPGERAIKEVFVERLDKDYSIPYDESANTIPINSRNIPIKFLNL